MTPSSPRRSLRKAALGVLLILAGIVVFLVGYGPWRPVEPVDRPYLVGDLTLQNAALKKRVERLEEENKELALVSAGHRFDAPEHLGTSWNNGRDTTYRPAGPVVAVPATPHYYSARGIYALPSADDRIEQEWVRQQICEIIDKILHTEYGPAPREVWVGTLMLNEDPTKGRILATPQPDRQIIAELYSPDAAVLKRMFELNFRKARITGTWVKPENHPEKEVFWVKTVEAAN